MGDKVMRRANGEVVARQRGILRERAVPVINEQGEWELELVQESEDRELVACRWCGEEIKNCTCREE